MNCNLKNKTVAVIALTFAFALAVNSACFAADDNVAANAENSTPSSAVENVVDSVEAPQAVENAAEDANNALQNASEQEAAALADIAKLNSEIKQVEDELKDLDIENPLPNEEGEDLQAEGDPSATNPLLDADPSQVDDELPIDNSDPFAEDSPIAEDFNDLTVSEDGSEIPAAEAPKSPLESFGNAILSKVDNNLFNQMSRIEKQTTLLRLELKREELKNQVITLRQMRTKMLEEEAERKRALEAKIKEEEVARQAKILEEERKLKEKEIELEKLRQAKVINDYMNEMLIMNQQWVEKNAKLQNRIHELEDERVELIETFKGKMETLGADIMKVHEKAQAAADKHIEVVSRLNSKIENLKTSIKNLRVELRESNIKIRDLQKQLQEAAANPFKGTVVKDVTEEINYDDFNFDEVPVKEDKDITKFYAIEEIIGNDSELVAKLVDLQNTSGDQVKEFIVRKGTVMKDGSVVTSITEKYVIFESPDGDRSYLYPGSITMDFEPEDSHGMSKIDMVGDDDDDADVSPKADDNSKKAQEKLSETGKKARASKSKSPTKASRTTKSSSSSKSSSSKTTSSSKSKKNSGDSYSLPSFGKGMFVR